MTESALTIETAPSPVSALLTAPDAAPWCACVLAHGAGAGMRHAFLASAAAAYAERGIATLRYQFPYAERGLKRVDPPAVAHATVRAAVARARELLPGVPLVGAGKSFGGRMTSGAHAEEPLPGVVGIAFLGFPLHPPGRPATDRAAHLDRVGVPMLFLQGTRDEFARRELLEPVVAALGARAALRLLEDGDHSFAVRRKLTGLSADDVRAWLADGIADWARGICART